MFGVISSCFFCRVIYILRLVGTIYETDIATAKDVAIALGHTFVGTHLAAIDVDLGLTEDVAFAEQAVSSQGCHHLLVHIQGTVTAPAVLTSATAKDVALHMSVIHLNLRLTWSEDAHVAAFYTGCRGEATTRRTGSDGTQLAATVEAAANGTAVHGDVGFVHITVYHITATKGVTGLLNGVRLLIVQFLYIFIDGGARCGGILVAVSDITIIDGQVGRTIHRATLTTTIGITLDGRNAVVEAGAVHLTNHHIGYGRDITCVRGVDAIFCDFQVHRVHRTVLTSMTLIAAAIDVTTHTALNIDVGSSYEVISGIIIFCQFKLVHHNTSLTTAIDILIHIAALQLNVGAARYHGILTITATVRITTHITTFHDVDIGLVEVAC